MNEFLAMLADVRVGLEPSSMIVGFLKHSFYKKTEKVKRRKLEQKPNNVEFIFLYLN
jgi:hypothetical protein